jgi:hypothetical protein
VTRVSITAPDGSHDGHFAWEKAQRWDDRDPATGDGCRGAGRGDAVMLTAGGRWVMERWTDWGGESPSYAAITAEAARGWLLRNGSDGAVGEFFGPVPDEEHRDPGRPAIGSRVNVFLGDLRGQADAARLPGESLSDAIRRLIAAGLAATG